MRLNSGFFWIACILGLVLPGPCPALGDVLVATPIELRNAIVSANAGGDPTILLADGTYTLPADYYLLIDADDVTIRSQSGRRDAVIIQGQGMGVAPESIFKVRGDNFTCRDMTLRRTGNHVIQIFGNDDADGTVLRNLVIQDGYEQLVKISARFEAGAPYSDNGTMEGCLLEYTAGVGPQWYIGGIDGHRCRGWVVRGNTFKGIISPEDQLAEHAVHFWSSSEDTLVEGNTILNCDRGIGFGLGSSTHLRGVIRNNMIAHDSTDGDVGIGLESSAGAAVYNNSIWFGHDYPWAIEYRFAATTGAVIRNNLTNKAIVSRDGGSGTADHNIIDALPAWFRTPAQGDLHLVGRIGSVVGQGTRDIIGLPEDFRDWDGQQRGDRMDIGADEWRVPLPSIPGLLLLGNE